jgi:hypothetical protein
MFTAQNTQTHSAEFQYAKAGGTALKVNASLPN